MGADAKLKSVLSAKGKENCPDCSKPIDRGDVAWNTGCTDPGTGYSVMEIICEGCSNEIVHGSTWYLIESFDEFVDELEEFLNKQKEE